MDHADPAFTADLEAALPRLRRYARILAGGPDEADDLVARTLAGVWATPRCQSHGSDFVTWLFGLVRLAHRPVLSMGQFSVRSDDSAGSPATARMRGRVSRLPIEEREVLMLVAVERLSYADTAQVLDAPIATVMSTLARARGHLSAMESGEADSRPMT